MSNKGLKINIKNNEYLRTVIVFFKEISERLYHEKQNSNALWYEQEVSYRNLNTKKYHVE